MMSLQDIVIEAEYRTLSVDMANDFYIPLLMRLAVRIQWNFSKTIRCL